MAIIGYIRVSSNKQTLEHQEFEIKKFAKSQKIKIDRWVEEKISSRKPLAKRQLGQLLNELKEGDILIACEISRLGRSLLEVMRILESCLNKNCQVQHMLKNPFYYGVMRVKKKFYPHKYPPLITKDLWDRLQDVMNNRARAPSHLNDIDELKAKQDRLLTALLDGDIDREIFKLEKAEYEGKIKELEESQSKYRTDNKGLTDLLVQIADIAANAGKLFDSPIILKKREILKLVLSDSYVNEKKLYFSITKPFDKLFFSKGYKTWCRW